MNEANRAVREAARDLVVEILGALGVQPQRMMMHAVLDLFSVTRDVRNDQG
jgi:hypothetical protein